MGHICGLKSAVCHGAAVHEGLHCGLNLHNSITGHNKGCIGLVVMENICGNSPVRSGGGKSGKEVVVGGITCQKASEPSREWLKLLGIAIPSHGIHIFLVYWLVLAHGGINTQGGIHTVVNEAGLLEVSIIIRDVDGPTLSIIADITILGVIPVSVVLSIDINSVFFAVTILVLFETFL